MTPRRPPSVEVLRHHSKSFYFAARLLSKDHFHSVAQLYDFCRYVDDLVDDADCPLGARDHMNRILADLESGVPKDPVVAQFVSLAETCDFSIDPARHLIHGQLRDLDEVQMKDDAELKTYCYQVAGTVGLLMCGVLGVRDPRAFPHAIDLGIGMQLTNIARDVEEDARAGRRYLPASLVGPLSPKVIAARDPEIMQPLQQGVREILKDAERYYRSGESGLAYLPPRSRLGIFVASRIYHAIGSELRRQRFTPWRQRATVRFPRKVAIATTTSFEYLKRACMHDAPSQHDAGLHRHLLGCRGAHLPVGSG